LDFVVDLSRAGLDGVEMLSTGLRCGATTTLQTLLEDPRLQDVATGLLESALERTRTEPWRRQATLAGRLLERDPGDLIEPCLTVLGARLQVQRTVDSGRETLDLQAGLNGAAPHHGKSTDHAPLIVAFEIPAPSSGWGFALEAATRSAQDTPLAAVAAGVCLQRGKIVAARVATSGLPTPRPAPATMAAVLGCDGTDFALALAALPNDIAPTDDWRASAAYRQQIAAVLLGRALRRACEAARRNGG
jgi:CO/xanthine dehydrogenase FAD-binding subunit